VGVKIRPLKVVTSKGFPSTFFEWAGHSGYTRLMIKKKSVLNSTVIRLGLVSLFADISSEMLYPITPLFLTMTLGASMASVGFIEGLAEAFSSILKAYSGRWSDHLGKRKPFVWTGYLLAAIAKPLIGLASTSGLVLFARCLDRTGKGLRSAPRDALLGDSVSVSQRGAAFGWHRFMDTLGAVIGPLIAILYLSFYPSNLRPIFIWAIIPGLLAVLISLTISDIPSRAKEMVKRVAWNWKTIPVPFKRYLGGWILFSLVNSSDVFLLLVAKERGVGTITVILLYCFYNLSYALLSPSLGALSDRIGRKRCLQFGLLVFAAVYFGISLATTTLHFVLLFGVYGIYMAATDGVGKALALDLVDESHKASALGLLATVTGLATLVASTVAGILWERVSPSATFIYGAVGSLVAFVAISVLLKPKH